MRVHKLAQPYSLSSLDSYWALNMHDNHYGRVTALACSHDDSYLVTAGADGNIFVYTANLQTPPVQTALPAHKVLD